jgi:predicted Zn-dependent protease
MISTRTLAICFGWAVLFGLCANSGFAQAGRGTISGYVFGPERRPISQAAVELRNDVNSVVGRTRTNGAGQFIFFRVPNGRFSVMVLPLGTNFEPQSQDVELSGIGVRGNQIPGNVQLDFYLTLRKDSRLPSQTGVVFIQDVPAEAKRVYEAAVSDLETKRLDQGLNGLRESIELFPAYYLALERLGSELIKLAEYVEAIKRFSAAVAVNPRSFSCWYGLAVANFALRKWEPAVEGVSKALEIEKNSVQALVVLGISQRSLRKFEESEGTLLRAKSLDNVQTPDIYWNLALLYTYDLKRYQEAADALELYLKANSRIPDTEKKKIRRLIKQLRENRTPSE